MRPPDSPRPIPATASTMPARPTAPALASVASPGSLAFSDVYQQVRSEVNDFIARGGTGFGTAAAEPAAADGNALDTLSPEGRLHLARSQPLAPAPAPGVDSSIEQQFLAAIAPMAQDAGRRLGVAPELVAAHAALESGWGRRPVRTRSGADSYNLFGIKAGGGWSGAVASAATTEYGADNGGAHATSADFRSYPDQASAFRDYTRLLLDNPRYGGALHAGADGHAFALGLARGGYATDPAYATKLSQLAARLQRNAATAPGGD